MKKKRFGQIATSHLFLIKGNEILLLRRFNTGFRDGEYSVIAGHIEEKESALKTIIREAKEEAGIKLAAKNLKLVHVMHRDENEKRIDFFFAVKRWQGVPKIMEPEKCDDLAWFEIRNLPKNTVPYIKQAINSFCNKMIYSQYGWKK